MTSATVLYPHGQWYPALKRFLRTVVPQIPAVLAYLNGAKPEWAAELALVGAALTAFNKYARDKGWKYLGV